MFQHTYTWNILSLIVYRMLSLLSCPETSFSNNGCYTIYGSGAVLLALRFFSCVFYRTFSVCLLAPLYGDNSRASDLCLIQYFMSVKAYLKHYNGISLPHVSSELNPQRPWHVTVTISDSQIDFYLFIIFLCKRLKLQTLDTLHDVSNRLSHSLG